MRPGRNQFCSPNCLKCFSTASPFWGSFGKAQCMQSHDKRCCFCYYLQDGFWYLKGLLPGVACHTWAKWHSSRQRQRASAVCWPRSSPKSLEACLLQTSVTDCIQTGIAARGQFLPERGQHAMRARLILPVLVQGITPLVFHCHEIAMEYGATPMMPLGCGAVLCACRYHGQPFSHRCCGSIDDRVPPL